MDLGIRGRHALVLASSQGLGLGVATALAAEGARRAKVSVTLVGDHIYVNDSTGNSVESPLHRAAI